MQPAELARRLILVTPDAVAVRVEPGWIQIVREDRPLRLVHSAGRVPARVIRMDAYRGAAPKGRE
jgi:hypothetical protein